MLEVGNNAGGPGSLLSYRAEQLPCTFPPSILCLTSTHGAHLRPCAFSIHLARNPTSTLEWADLPQ